MVKTEKTKLDNEKTLVKEVIGETITNGKKYIQIIEKMKKYDEESNISIYIGTGLYQISVGLILAILISFLIRLPLSALNLYPYLTAPVFWSIKILGYIILGFGIFTCLYPFIKRKTTDRKLLEKITKINLIISCGITFLLIPIGPFLGLSLRSEIINSTEKKRKEKSYAKIYFALLFVTGFIHLALGILLAIFLPDLLIDQYALIYPVINAETITFITILGWICLIPGVILIFCAFWSGKFSKIESIDNQGIILKIIRNLILISSVFIIIIFPVGTFFGLTIVQEFYSLKIRDK